MVNLGLLFSPKASEVGHYPTELMEGTADVLNYNKSEFLYADGANKVRVSNAVAGIRVYIQSSSIVAADPLLSAIVVASWSEGVFDAGDCQVTFNRDGTVDIIAYLVQRGVK